MEPAGTAGSLASAAVGTENVPRLAATTQAIPTEWVVLPLAVPDAIMMSSLSNPEPVQFTASGLLRSTALIESQFVTEKFEGMVASAVKLATSVPPLPVRVYLPPAPRFASVRE